MGRLETMTAALGLLLLPRPAAADCEDGRPRTIGHRGAGGSSAQNPYPENTIPSILAAAEQGATMVEIDVQLSADGVPVLIHDVLVDETTNGMGCVSDLTVAELQMLDAAVGTPMEGMGVVIPTLEQVLQATPLDLNVELKVGELGCPVIPDPQFATAVLDVLDTDPTPREVLISSFDFPLVEEVRALAPERQVGQLAVTPASAPPAAAAGFDALVLAEAAVDEAALTTVRDAGLEIVAWTVNDPARLAELFELDVDGIITDEPDVMEQVRADACPEAADTGTSTGMPMEPADGTSSTTGTSPGSTGELPAGTSGTTAPQDPTSAPAEDSGCACRASTQPRPAALALWLMGLALASRRRR